MVSSRQIIAWILLSLSLSVAVYAQAQSGAAKEQTANVSGKITVKNKGVAGIVVVATDPAYGDGSQQPARLRSTTDDEGNYRISDIPAGNYYVFPLAPALVDKTQSRRLLTIAAGESIRDFDFAMVRGGVITGRITNADGQPIVEENVNVMPIDSALEYRSHNPGILTDDRGIYRAFGLRQGKYRVWVGQSAKGLPGFPRTVALQTYYPSVTEISKATVIEVTEGSETKDVDIVVVGSISTFTVSGRVVDSTGKPVPGVVLGVQQSDENSTMSSTGGAETSSNGEFKLQNVMPGKYTLFIASLENTDSRADPLPIEVIDRDLTGLEIKTKTGAGLSGTVVLDGPYEKSVVAKFKGLRVFGWIDGPSSDFDSGSRSVEIGADGSFKLSGLGSGNIHFGFVYSNESDARQFEIVQIEHNGVVQPSGVSVKEGERVDGVRIVVRHLRLTGVIRGQVKIENGELPPNARIVVWVNFADPSRGPRTSFGAPEVDARGRFLLQRLAPATYEVRAGVFESGKRISRDDPKQVITVTDNSVTEVNLTVKLKP